MEPIRLVSDQLPIKAGPVPDRVSLWPLDDGRYGLDAIFHGVSGYERMEQHEQELKTHRVPHSSARSLAVVGRSDWVRFERLKSLAPSAPSSTEQPAPTRGSDRQKCPEICPQLGSCDLR